MYEDGNPGEIFIKMAKEGSTLSGFMDGFALSVSIGLQYGVPLKALVDKFMNTRFEPSGFTGHPSIPYAKSVLDYIGRWLGGRFISADYLTQLLVWPSPKPPYYGMALAIGVVMGMLVFYKLVFLRRQVFGEGMMFLYDGLPAAPQPADWPGILRGRNLGRHVNVSAYKRRSAASAGAKVSTRATLDPDLRGCAISPVDWIVPVGELWRGQTAPPRQDRKTRHSFHGDRAGPWP